MTQNLTKRDAEEPLGEDTVEAVIQRLDRLTPEEARTTALQTLEVIHSLVQNMRVTMDGETTLSTGQYSRLNILLSTVGGKVLADNIWRPLGMLVATNKLSVFLTR